MLGRTPASGRRNYARRATAGRVVCFEPMLDAFRQITEPEKLRVALGNRDGEATLNISGGNSQSSSLYPMANRHFTAAPDTAYVTTETVPVHRLDAYDFDDRCYLKIDAQGAEREILDGATETLGRCVGLEIELSLIELYHGQTLAHEFIPLLYGWGFRTLAMWPGFTDPMNGEVLQVNGMFGDYALDTPKRTPLPSLLHGKQTTLHKQHLF